ncbi:hypothetical protein EDC01DRAFT_666767 [Geopyxis carbonaria]|nr:hypothetical protein EDC01DRAFT_666767 [Geopyxis carbonaria]
MANKASKALARANAATLNKTHMITASIHVLFIIYRLLFRGGSWKKYILISLPSLVLEFYLERLGRPVFNGNELKKAGEDMAAKGVTEYCWDIVYVTWIVLGLVGIAGEWAWWIAAIVPLYGAFLAWTTYSDMRKGIMPGMPKPMGAEGEEGEAAAGGQSKRQKKLEKRGGQQVKYR